MNHLPHDPHAGSHAHPFRDALIAEHDRLDADLTALYQLVVAGEHEAAIRAWDAFEADLLGHLEAEELHLLPALAGHDPGRALTIAEEHARIRVFAAEIEMTAPDLEVPLASLRELAATLRAHGDREIVALYEWADEWLSDRVLAAMCHAAPPERVHRNVAFTGVFGDEGAEDVMPASTTYRVA
jgi:hypothetical protein